MAFLICPINKHTYNFSVKQSNQQTEILDISRRQMVVLKFPKAPWLCSFVITFHCSRVDLGKNLCGDPSNNTERGPPPPHVHHKAQHPTCLFFPMEREAPWEKWIQTNTAWDAVLSSLAMWSNSRIVPVLCGTEHCSLFRVYSCWSHCLGRGGLSPPVCVSMVTSSWEIFPSFPLCSPTWTPKSSGKNLLPDSLLRRADFHVSALRRLPAVNKLPNLPGVLLCKTG